MAERRPMVSLDGTIHYGLREDQKRLIEENGFDANKAHIIRDDNKAMLVRVDGTYYLLYKEGKTNG